MQKPVRKQIKHQQSGKDHQRASDNSDNVFNACQMTGQVKNLAGQACNCAQKAVGNHSPYVVCQMCECLLTCFTLA